MLSLPSTSGHCLRWKRELRCMENAHHRGVNTLVASQSTFLNWKSRSSFLEGIAGKEVRVGELFRRCGNRRQDCGVPHLVARASISYRSKLGDSSSLHSCQLQKLCLGLYGTRQQIRRKRIRGQEDDFEVEDAVDYEMDGQEEDDDDEGDLRDYETEYDMPMGDYLVQESETFMSTEGGEEERIVDYKIDEEEFHKLSLYDCDFFIRKVPDQDDDVFDFREMYVTPPDTDVYAIPKVIGNMPKKPLRCMKSNYDYICVTEPPVDTPRAPLYKSESQVMKVFLIKHLRNLREDDENFILDFEEIYVIDSKTKAITRADVQVEVKTGKYRDRSAETLIVRDDGNTFRLIPTELRHTPDEVIGALQWDRTKENMDNYLQRFSRLRKIKLVLIPILDLPCPPLSS